MKPYRLLEDHRAVAVHQYPVLQVPADGAGEYAPLYLATEAHQVLHGVAVGDVRHVAPIVFTPLSWARR